MVDQKNVLIFNSYTLQKVHQIKTTVEGVIDIVFGEKD